MEPTKLNPRFFRSGAGEPPQLDVQAVNGYRRQTDKLFRQGEPAERKKLLRALVEDIRLMPEDHEVTITYRLPEAIEWIGCGGLF